MAATEPVMTHLRTACGLTMTSKESLDGRGLQLNVDEACKVQSVA